MASIKGTAMLNSVKFLRANFREEALELLPPELHKYLNARILASMWYPEEDALALIRVMARLMKENVPGVGDDVYAYMGRTVAQADFTTFYANLIRPNDPEETLTRVVTTWRMYHDTGSSHASFEGPGRARVDLKDYALPSKEMCSLIKGFREQMLIMAGAQEVSSKEVSCRNRGDPICVWEMRWKAPNPS